MRTLISQTRSEADVRAWYRAGVWRQQTLARFLRFHAASRPGDVALADDRRRLTFRQYDEEASRIATALENVGVSRDWRVAIWLSGRVEFPLVRVALSRLGAVAVILNPALGPGELVAALRQARCSALVTATRLGKTDTAEAVAAAGRECPDLEATILVDGEGDGSLQRLLAGVPVGDGAPSEPHRPHEVDDILFTSGTTGAPKGVLSCQARWLTACASQRRAGGFGPDDVGLVLAPVGGTIGYLKSVVLPLLSGAATVLSEERDLSTLVEIAQREGVTYVAAVPAQLIGLIEQLERPGVLPLRVVFYGGAAMPAGAGMRLRELTGCFLLTSIGSTEAGTPGGTHLGDSPQVQTETVGSAYPGSRIAVRDGDGRELPAGELGALYSTGATIFDGYLDDPEATAGCFDGEWIRHGDLAWIDGGGYVRFAGRADDVINRGGTKVAPVEVEAVLARHPAVLEVAVTGVPDGRLGERVCAFVRPRPGVALSLADVRAFVAEAGAARSMQPERLELVDRLPLSPGGKVDRRALRARLAAPERSEGGRS